MPSFLFGRNEMAEKLHFSVPDIQSLVKAKPIDTENREVLAAALKAHKINQEEYETLTGILGRQPSLAELGVFSSMWSEHCSYKSSRVHLKRLPATGKNVVVGPGENAGIVRLSGKLCAAFKMESHNHPSYIEPYQGAATGVGGILRDVFCMGARPVANLNALRFGERSHPRTHYLLEYVTKGIGDYGNCIGVPTIAGNVSFDATYNGNCLVNAMTVGLIHEDRIFKGYASGKDNLVVYVGSATGRDGIHGATMASDSFESGDSSQKTTVQVGDPFTEKLLLEATLEVLDKKLVVGLQDMGAAGLTSSSFEMADRAGSGLFMDLSRVPTRTQNMTAYELLLSESQERMLMVIEPSKWEALAQCLDKWELAYAVIGVVTYSGRVQIAHNGVLEVDVPVAPLTDKAPKYSRPLEYTTPQDLSSDPIQQKVDELGWRAVVKKILNDVGDKTPIYRQYDYHIGTKTVFGPEHQGAGLLWVRSPWAAPGDEHLGLAVATSCNERYCQIDPKEGAAYAVLKSARMIAATGAEPIAITDCLNYGNPEDPIIMGQFSQGVDGITKACQELETPVVSGNVSLYNTTDGVSIAPTPMIGMVGRHQDVRKAVSACGQSEGPLAMLAPKTLQGSCGGSLLAKSLGWGIYQAPLPVIDWDYEKAAIGLLQEFVDKEYLQAARDVADGGFATCLAKMFTDLGATVTLPVAMENLGTWGLVADLNGAYLLQFKSDDALAAAMTQVPKEAQLYKLGVPGGSSIVIDNMELDLAGIRKSLEQALNF